MSRFDHLCKRFETLISSIYECTEFIEQSLDISTEELPSDLNIYVTKAIHKLFNNKQQISIETNEFVAKVVRLIDIFLKNSDTEADFTEIKVFLKQLNDNNNILQTLLLIAYLDLMVILHANIGIAFEILEQQTVEIELVSKVVIRCMKYFWSKQRLKMIKFYITLKKKRKVAFVSLINWVQSLFKEKQSMSVELT